MKLYHGTTERYLDAIKRDGITPRKARNDKSGNWKHSITSCPSAVYLTNSYAVHYAQCAANGNERLLILEIDSTRLSPFKLTPDEDFLEQATRKEPTTDANGKILPPGPDMKKRTIWFRNRLMQFAHAWKDSVKHLGNCCYHGTVPVQAITRYALLPRATTLAFMSDPTITLLNYRIMGGFYREYCKYVFGEKMDMGAAVFPDQLERLMKVEREGVEVIQM